MAVLRTGRFLTGFTQIATTVFCHPVLPDLGSDAFNITKSFKVSSRDQQAEIASSGAHTVPDCSVLFCSSPQAAQGQREERLLSLLDGVRRGLSPAHSKQSLTACRYATSSLGT